MPRNWQWGLLIVAVAVLAGCAGSTAPADFTPDVQELDYALTADAGSTINPALVNGTRVPLAEALAAGGGQLPPGFNGIQGMNFTPGAEPGAGFSGSLNVAVEQEHQAAQLSDGTRLYLYYASAAGVRFVDSARLQGGWATFRINMLGYFIIAQNPGIPDLSNVFAAFAFADLTEAAVGEELNCWAVAINGAAPYTFSWNMGDGTQLSGDQVAHAYTDNGAYSIIVTASDATGLTTTAFSTPVTVTGGPANDLSVDVAIDPNLENPLLFSYGVTVTGGTAPYAYSWDFDGDGGEDATSANPDFTFATNGIFAGVLTITDADGNTSTGNFISDARSLVLAASPLSGIAPLSADFTIEAAGFNAGDTITLDFGDAQDNLVAVNPGQTTYMVMHSYAAGSYTAQATGVSSVSGTDYTIASNQLALASITPPTRPVAQLTQPILPSAEQTFDILGFAFGDSQGAKTVLLDTTPLTVNSWSDTVINASYPTGFNGDAGALTVVDPVEGASNPLRITLNRDNQPAGVQNVLPLQLEPDGYVLIIGHGFGELALSVNVGSTALEILEWGDNAIVAQLDPAQATGGQTMAIAVNIGGPTLNVPVEVAAASTIPYPELTSANPVLQEIGTGGSMELSGMSFSDGYGGLVFGRGLVTPVASWSDTLITITDPLNTIEGGVVVLNRERPSNPLDITYMRRPVISSINPDFGEVGDLIMIQGAFFGTQQPGDQVTLGGTPLATDYWSDVQINFTLPAGAADGNIVVEKALSSNAMPFDVVPPTPDPPGGEQL